MDRLEELLAMMEAEDEDEEEAREDGPALTDRTVPAAPEDEGETLWEDAPAERAGERPDRSAGEIETEDGPDSAEEPLWPADGGISGAEAAWRREMADRRDQAVEAVRTAAETGERRLSAETGGELARTVRHGGDSGLEGLYRQAVQASRPVPQALPVEQAGRTFRAEEPGRTAALTVDELDRMVRRDCRRYDGGMTIF